VVLLCLIHLLIILATLEGVLTEVAETTCDVSNLPSTSEGPNKYLELIYDEDEPPVCQDGYEVPRSSIRRNLAQTNGEIIAINRENRLSSVSTGATTTFQNPGTLPLRVTMIEPICINGTVRRTNSLRLPSYSNCEAYSHYKSVPRKNGYRNAFIRNSSVVSRISDDEKLNNGGQGDRLLNGISSFRPQEKQPSQ
jgi:hypothetical protein